MNKESIEEQEKREEREWIEREELEKRIESIGSIGGKAELEFLSELIWKDIKVLENIYIRYRKLLGKIGISSNTISGIFDRNYETFSGIIMSLNSILGYIIRAKD